MIEADEDDQGLRPLNGGPLLEAGEQYAKDAASPYPIGDPHHHYHEITSIACGHCPIIVPLC